ncbi:hypothetical protein [Deinococcus hopiensis]|uniref:DUF306 domain-containing protein n=1 Tax=Deinococcus hopiensis KR-140 TaxID=695939 RepID=A0A1W1UQ21_9DEIO|nr:hypothetical protein [Deinococcus hopiensis]SMB82901.1 hypothetical protein SAMN00790413_04183 [Deinococcus hopiensis KR-140]
MFQKAARAALTLAALPLASAAPAAQGGSPVTAPMLGSWVYGTLSSTDYYDPTTDRWQDASGATEIVTFMANGRYERTRLLSLTTYGCTSKLLIYEKGTVKIGGDRVTYRPQEGVNKGYTCRPSNGWSNSEIHPETWTFRFERDSNGGDILVMQGQSGSVAHYNRYKR